MHRWTLRVLLAVLLGLVSSIPPAAACIWDSDTLDDEVRGLPEAMTLIVTDRWFRHGEAYYQHRLATLPARIEKEPGNLALYDDLAVAEERLGRYDAAIALMDRKLKRLASAPDREHEYRAWANRGTFLSHAGRYDEALADIERALEINPNAHFGRERIQVMVIRYLQAAKADPAVWGQGNFLEWNQERVDQENKAILEAATSTSEAPAQPQAPPSPPIDKQAAYDAIVGILRFGGPEGAELWRTLGDLNRSRRDLNLAWWCYMRAVEKKHPASVSLGGIMANLEQAWKSAGAMFVPTRSIYSEMRKSSARWQQAFHAAEAKAIAEGRDAGDENVLEGLMAAADRVAGRPPSHSVFRLSGNKLLVANILGTAVLLIGLIVYLGRLNRPKNPGPPSAEAPPSA